MIFEARIKPPIHYDPMGVSLLNKKNKGGKGNGGRCKKDDKKARKTIVG